MTTTSNAETQAVRDDRWHCEWEQYLLARSSYSQLENRLHQALYTTWPEARRNARVAREFAYEHAADNYIELHHPADNYEEPGTFDDPEVMAYRAASALTRAWEDHIGLRDPLVAERRAHYEQLHQTLHSDLDDDIIVSPDGTRLKDVLLDRHGVCALISTAVLIAPEPEFRPRPDSLVYCAQQWVAIVADNIVHHGLDVRTTTEDLVATFKATDPINEIGPRPVGMVLETYAEAVSAGVEITIGEENHIKWLRSAFNARIDTLITSLNAYTGDDWYRDVAADHHAIIDYEGIVDHDDVLAHDPTFDVRTIDYRRKLTTDDLPRGFRPELNSDQFTERIKQYTDATTAIIPLVDGTSIAPTDGTWSHSLLSANDYTNEITRPAPQYPDLSL